LREVEGQRVPPAWACVPRSLRRRARGAQGNPGKTPDLGTALYQWFVDHRSLIKGRARTRLVMSQTRVLAGRPLPLEQLFKAKTGTRILRSLVVLDEQRYTLQTSPSGSYRVQHVITFLERHLLPWSEERSRSKDYRILSLDAYKCHMDPAVEALAWSRGYVRTSTHRASWCQGGSTGVVQGPDTDLHAWVESELVRS